MFSPSAPEQVTEFNKTALEAVLSLAKISFDTTERLIGLNLEASKESFAEITKSAKALVEVKDANSLLELRSKLTESGVEKVMEYSRSLYEVAQQTQGQLSAVLELHTAELNKNVAAAIEKAVKTAPAGADVAIAAMKSSVAATAAAVDSVTKAAKQVASFADASVKATTDTVSAAVKTSKAK
jgi:phasin family protein